MEWEFGILYAMQRLHTDWLDQAMTAVTGLGDKGWFWIALGAALALYVRTRKTGILILCSLLVGAVVGNLLLKNLIARPRPCWIDESILLLVQNPRDYSFPSGHTLASFEAAVTVFLQNRRWGMAALLLAALIAFSRMYLFVHFPTDVLGGALLGTGIVFLVCKAADRIQGVKGKP